MARTTTTPVICPGMCGPNGAPACGGETVQAKGLLSFSATTVSVSACSVLLAQGWCGPQMVLRKSDAGQLVTPGATSPVRHSAGLVVFA